MLSWQLDESEKKRTNPRTSVLRNRWSIVDSLGSKTTQNPMSKKYHYYSVTNFSFSFLFLFCFGDEKPLHSRTTLDPLLHHISRGPATHPQAHYPVLAAERIRWVAELTFAISKHPVVNFETWTCNLHLLQSEVLPLHQATSHNKEDLLTIELPIRTNLWHQMHKVAFLILEPTY